MLQSTDDQQTKTKGNKENMGYANDEKQGHRRSGDQPAELRARNQEVTAQLIKLRRKQDDTEDLNTWQSKHIQHEGDSTSAYGSSWHT